MSQGDDSSLDVLGKADMPPGHTSKCRHGRMLPPKKRSKAAAAERGRTIEVDACRKKPRLLGLTVHRQSSCELCSAFFSLYTEGSHSRAEQLASLPLSESSFSLLPSSTAWDCTGSASTGFLPRLRKPMAFVPDGVLRLCSYTSETLSIAGFGRLGCRTSTGPVASQVACSVHVHHHLLLKDSTYC